MMYNGRYFAYISFKWSNMTSHGQSICGRTTKDDNESSSPILTEIVNL